MNEEHAWSQEELDLFSPPRDRDRLTGPDEALTALAARWTREVGAEPVAARLRVVWNPRLQTTAGTASPRHGTIELNPRLWSVGITQVHRTLKHEAAHLIAHWRSGRRRIQTHGEEWRQACQDLGIPDETACHNLPFPRRQIKRKLAYQCPSCALVVQRVRKFARFTACFRCCRKYADGKYDARFQFLKLASPPGA